ncbi:hypothetical protein [Pseudomonas sp. HMWF006]|uniref:hypothetical protein n=1 Tax=Pseudomonas sp. HMWF006 TaxID=2056843 RepID=UPI000D413ABC|nr:hypothetical protein [Pseudomonas sp. HMWF006]PTT04344.1 hypothetical protein DBR24_03365 [Pseudomonas sp. HMWF006]PTT94477.1 hypothetical protein DBR29_03550 [Pseudomonas sp. HMWF005]
MTQNVGSTKHNLLDMYACVQKNAPLTVGQYLDDFCPERHSNPQHAEYAGVLFEMFQSVSNDELFDMVLPVTETSVIRGFTPTALAGMSILLKMAERKLI